jgi:hypothetical protein
MIFIYFLTVFFIFHKQERCGAPPFPVGEIGRKPRNMEYFEIQVNENLFLKFA